MEYLHNGVSHEINILVTVAKYFFNSLATSYTFYGVFSTFVTVIVPCLVLTTIMTDRQKAFI